MRLFTKVTSLTVASLSMMAALSAPTYAADKALIIGVGEYQDPKYNLNGINYDVDMATDIAKRLGIQESNITTLTDSQATLGNVRLAFKNIANSVNSDDTVLIYFSGHGSQVEDSTGDEADGQDETLVLHDAQLVDDEVNKLLSNIKSDNMVVLIDACHSGTGTKSLGASSLSASTQRVQVKSMYEAGLQDKNFYLEPVTQDANIQSDSYIAIGAAQDSQESLATDDGSIFTKKLFESFEEARKKSNTTTWQSLYDNTKYKIESLPLPDEKRFTPKLQGKNASKQIRILAPNTSASKVNWTAMTRGIDAINNNIQISAPSSLNVGDVLEFSVTAPDDGYLHVITVGADDETMVLFPNEYATDNKVIANQTLTLPGNGKFKIPAQEPRGDSMIAVFHTPNQIDLQSKGYGQLNDNGMSKGNTFAKGSASVFLDSILDIQSKNFVVERVSDSSSPSPSTHSDKKGKYVIINVK